VVEEMRAVVQRHVDGNAHADVRQVVGVEVVSELGTEDVVLVHPLGWDHPAFSGASVAIDVDILYV
jgi:hypothetical protein